MQLAATFLAKYYKIETNLWHEIGRVDPSSLGINSAKLALVVVDELDGLGLQVPEGDGFGEGGHPRKGTSFRSKN